MSESNKYIIFVEVLKYLYCGKSIESNEFLSKKICCSAIKVRKKILKKAKWNGKINYKEKIILQSILIKKLIYFD